MSALLGRTVHVRLLVCQGFSRSHSKNVFRLSTNSFFLVSSYSSRFQSSTTMAQKKPFERLPTSVLPKNYKLTLQPNLTEFTFAGGEVIDVEVIKHCVIICTTDPIHSSNPQLVLDFLYTVRLLQAYLPLSLSNSCYMEAWLSWIFCS